MENKINIYPVRVRVVVAAVVWSAHLFCCCCHSVPALIRDLLSLLLLLLPLHEHMATAHDYNI